MLQINNYLRDSDKKDIHQVNSNIRRERRRTNKKLIKGQPR